jgi:hypothetical protein
MTAAIARGSTTTKKHAEKVARATATAEAEAAQTLRRAQRQNEGMSGSLAQPIFQRPPTASIPTQTFFYDAGDGGFHPPPPTSSYPSNFVDLTDSPLPSRPTRTQTRPSTYLSDQYGEGIADVAAGRLAGGFAQPPSRLNDLLDAAIQLSEEERSPTQAKKTTTRRF